MFVNHHMYLLWALAQASQRRGFCAPNPAVGAVVVKEGKILAMGNHWAAGHPHAEVNVLNQIKGEARGAELYVTLEPCCHYGKTPPCTTLIEKSGIKKVYFAEHDPNPKMNGKGIAALTAGGIACEQIISPEITEFYRSYRYWWTYQKPWITAKLALSADEKIAGKNGKKKLITGDVCQHYTHRLRRCSDAILTTVKTIIHDDPKLNVRIKDETIAKPIYILDARLEIPLQAQIWQTASRLVLFHDRRADQNRIDICKQQGAECIELETKNHLFDLREIIEQIGAHGIHDLWIESGGKFFTSLFQSGQACRILLYFSPKSLGEEAYPALQHPLEIFASADKVDWRVMGEDIVLDLCYDHL